MGPSPGSPLDSPALGTDLDRLATRCGRGPRPTQPAPPTGRPSLGVALSGGGFRATFAALGVLRYLADAGLLRDLRYASSVSGGSVANGALARRWPELRQRGYDSAALDELVIEPMVARVSGASLKWKLVRNAWRAIGPKTRTDVLASAFDDWFYRGQRLADLDAECRWIVNAANLTTGVRFGFERDVVGDYVLGSVRTADTDLRLAQAVAASAAVPGAFAPMKLEGLPFPCAEGRIPRLLDGGAYDNTGLEAIDSDTYRDVFTIAVNAGGVFVTGRYGKIPLVRELARSNSLLYRQSTSLRARWMVERFRAWERTPDDEAPPPSARRGVIFGLATTVEPRHAPPEFLEFVGRHPEHRTYDGDDLAFVPTVFDRLDRRLLRALVHRGWWLTGATLTRWHPGFGALPDDVEPPAVTS